jgi:hypothetical protein
VGVSTGADITKTGCGAVKSEWRKGGHCVGGDVAVGNVLTGFLPLSGRKTNV